MGIQGRVSVNAAAVPHADVHMNVFWSYDNAELEDNCTRALMVTLRACGNETIAAFLREFTGQEGKEPFAVALQAAPLLTASSRHRGRLLSITSESKPRFAARHRALDFAERWDAGRRKIERLRIEKWLVDHGAADTESRFMVRGLRLTRTEAEALQLRLEALDRG